MSRELVINPYKNLDWSKVKKYKGNFHQHSTESDGRVPVSILIDQAEETDMDIFVISDHDWYRINRGKYPKFLDVSDPNAEYFDPERPSGKFRNIFPYHYFDGDLYYDPNEEGNYTELARSGSKGEFDIDEDDRVKGMLTFEACEFTEFHHIISLMSDADGYPGGLSEDELIKSSHDKGGITYFAHPGRHWDHTKNYKASDTFSPSWYKKILSSYDSCLGLEILNQGDKYKFDRILWDTINNLGFDTVPVWGFSGTDSHVNFTTRNHNVIFAEELTINSLKESLKNGSFYSVLGDAPPIINKISVDEGKNTITIDLDNPGDVIEWNSGGKIVEMGNKLNYNDVKGLNNSVRAVVRGNDGRSYTNPFYFNRFTKPKFN